jgi:hypothetical protein
METKTRNRLLSVEDLADPEHPQADRLQRVEEVGAPGIPGREAPQVQRERR